MKRVCTESEKELLYKNRDQMLEGIYQTASRSKLSHAFIVIFLSGIAMIAGVFLATVTFHPSKPVLIIWMLFCFFLARAIFSAIFNTIRINKGKKAFMHKDHLMINGATLVEVVDSNSFVYIEDDVLDEEGKPILIGYPARFLDVSQEDVGKRFLVIYDSDSNYQLVRLNNELSGLIPNHSPFYPLEGELNEYSHIPHPNMANVEKDGHELTESEKEKFARLYVKVVQSVSFRMMKTGMLGVVIASLVFCVLVSTAEGGYPLEKTLPIAVAAWAGLALFMLFGILIGKGNLRRQAMSFIYVKEVIFHSYIIGDNTMTVKVYEWNDGQVQLCEYPAGNVAMNTVYGSMLYKFTTRKGLKGDYVLVNTSPVGKKRK